MRCNFRATGHEDGDVRLSTAAYSCAHPPSKWGRYLSCSISSSSLTCIPILEGGGLQALNHRCFSPLPYLFLSFYSQLLLISLLLGNGRRESEMEQGCGSRIRREGARRRQRGRGACRGARAQRARPQRRPVSAVSRSGGGAASSPPAAAAERGAGAGEGRRWWGRHGGGVGEAEQGLLARSIWTSSRGSSWSASSRGSSRSASIQTSIWRSSSRNGDDGASQSRNDGGGVLLSLLAGANRHCNAFAGARDCWELVLLWDEIPLSAHLIQAIWLCRWVALLWTVLALMGKWRPRRLFGI
jgi:hypothetical protein